MSNGKKPAKAGDESYAVLQSLIAKGRKEGMLRASELNAELDMENNAPPEPVAGETGTGDRRYWRSSKSPYRFTNPNRITKLGRLADEPEGTAD